MRNVSINKQTKKCPVSLSPYDLPLKWSPLASRAHHNPPPIFPKEGPCYHPPSSSLRRKIPWWGTELPLSGDTLHGVPPISKNCIPLGLAAPRRFGWRWPACSSAFRSRKKGGGWSGDCIKQGNTRKNHNPVLRYSFLFHLSDACHVQQASAL